MSAIDAFKAPSLVSKKTRKELVQDKDDVVIDSSTLSTQSMQEDVDMDESSSSSAISKPKFAAVSGGEANTVAKGIRRIPIPPHRMTPLKRHWMEIYTPLVEHMKLQVRMNIKSRTVEIRTCKSTEDPSALQKGADYVRAFALGFEVQDAMALLRLDDIYLDSFEIKDVKTLHGDHLARAIGRIAGRDGKTRFTIENASKTRIVLADTKIHILGSFQNIKVARDAICSLILGSPPGKVYASLRTVSARMKERF
ncbi:universal archaeal KH domain-containing protein [Lichtheimia ornata]|uniref:Pre-rRNA-processing protein PNO1 n=1 Tax=Lichtheimia ornata TaxID=688661 RepID=A0AAD7XZV0_9FUNG|nr:universal archaeal KH domain-containing protein [Lichtheimia ornata]KAJ8656362.1 universal archaeal KH domain-containing protein [Lichtheimia ornata]